MRHGFNIAFGNHLITVYDGASPQGEAEITTFFMIFNFI